MKLGRRLILVGLKKTIFGPNKKNNYILSSAQIDISNNLDQLIWSKIAGAVLTSATLSSLGSFARLNQQLGLVRDKNQYLRLPSPF
jgi:Rad3-related DNA helicases